MTEEAARAAQEVVGWYGDPTSTWGIAVELEFAEDVGDIARLADRGDRLVREHQWLGSSPEIESIAEQDWEAARAEFVAADFPGANLVRVARCQNGRRLLIAAHHGVCDGLGLIAIADLLSDQGLQVHARGIGDRAASQSFLRSGLRRLGEAVLSPPPRFLGTPMAEAGERLVTVSTEPLRAGTTVLCHRLAWTFAALSKSNKAPIFGIGASRRRGEVVPDRQTAFLRLRVRPDDSEDTLRKRLASIDPEPDFPESSAGGVGPLVTRLMRNRLGSTALVSNLGLITAPGLVSVAMFPSVNGPFAVGVGFASTQASSTFSVRVRACDYRQHEVEQILHTLAQAVTAGIET